MTSLESRPRILLAEDEEHIARLVAFKLGKSGFEIVHARNGQEALELLGRGSWALIILDVMMPLVDGWQVLQAARALPATAGVPVLMLTAKSFQQDLANASGLGATEFLKKPFDPSHLSRVVIKLAGGLPG